MFVGAVHRFKETSAVFSIWSNSFGITRETQRFSGCEIRVAMPGLYSPLSAAIKNQKRNDSVENLEDSAP